MSGASRLPQTICGRYSWGPAALGNQAAIAAVDGVVSLFIGPSDWRPI
jgi:hypothetical protein